MSPTTQELVAQGRRAERLERSAVRWRNRWKRLLLGLCAVLGASLSGTDVGAMSLSETQAALMWFLEGNKPNQASIWGRYPNSGFGGTLAVGDVNGDGLDDLITNARNTPESFPAGGEVYVIPGSLSFSEAYTMPQRAALIFEGISAEAQIGSYLDSGDMNGDGIDDIVMGSWTTELVHVFLGSADIQASSPMTIAAAAENMALTVSPAGSGLLLCDFNGDGYQDLFVQQLLLEDYLGVEVWGLLGSDTLTNTQPITRVVPSAAQVTIKGMPTDMWGSPNGKNMACGDIDGDGYSDLAIGIYGASPGHRHVAGMVYIVRGNPVITASNPVTLTMPDHADAIIEGVDGRLATNGDLFGAGMTSADVDLDGRADLILGAPGASGPKNLIQYAGEVYLWLGRPLVGQQFVISSQASWIVHGGQASESLGRAITAGDFDQDGYPEILLGCPYCSSTGPPFYLSGRGYVLEPLKIAGQAAVSAVSKLEIVPYRYATCIGEAVSAMDLDGDDASDVVISSPCTDQPEGNVPGTVFVVSYPDIFTSFLPFLWK